MLSYILQNLFVTIQDRMIGSKYKVGVAMLNGMITIRLRVVIREQTLERNEGS